MKVFFRSSYELKTLYHLDHSPLVDWYDYEPFVVPYYDTENKKRYYTVDLIIKFKGQPVLTAIEIKNDYSKSLVLNQNKYKGFQEYCGDAVILEVWSDAQIKLLGLDLDMLKVLPEVTLVKK
jgi:hypothetical protein